MLAARDFQFDSKSELDKMLIACLEGDIAVISDLLAKGLNVDSSNSVGQTPILAACLANQKRAVEILLEYKASVTHVDKGGYSPLHLTSDESIMEAIIEYSKTSRLDFNSLVNSKTKTNRTPLHEAAFHGPIERVNVLLKYHANVNAVDIDKNIPLHYACCRTNLDQSGLVSVLLSAGSGTNHQNIYLKTPLHLACNHHFIYSKVISLLLEAGANPCIVNADGNSALHCLFQGMYEFSFTLDMTLIDHLVSKGTVQLDMKNEYGELPLHLAIQSKLDENTILKFLKKYQYNVHGTDKLGRSILHLCCKYNYLEVLKYLITDEELANMTDSLGKTVLHYACICSENSFSAKIILDSSTFTKVEERDFFKNTAAMYAERRNCKEIVQLFKEIATNVQDSNPEQHYPDLASFLTPIVIYSMDNITPKSLRPDVDAGDYINKVLKISRTTSNQSEEEDSEIKRKTEIFMHSIIDNICTLDDRFSGHLVQVGSSYEGTTISGADFDYMLSLDKLSTICEVHECERDPAGFTRLKVIKGDHSLTLGDFCDETGFINPNKLMSRFSLLVTKAVCEPDLYRRTNFDFIKVLSVKWKDRPALTIDVFLNLKNKNYKSLNIDFVPAVQTSDWKPKNCSITMFKHILDPKQTSPCHLIIKPMDIPHYQHINVDGLPHQYLRVTFAETIASIFQRSPSYIRESLIIAKAMLRREIQMPLSVIYDYQGLSKGVGRFICNNFIKSFHLKHCLLLAMQETPSPKYERDEQNTLFWIRRIYETLCNSLNYQHLPNAFIPDNNILYSYKPDNVLQKTRYISTQAILASLQDSDKLVSICLEPTIKQRVTSDFEETMHKKVRHLQYALQGPDEKR